MEDGDQAGLSAKHQVSLAILQTVKTAQNQHGLRHNDQKRYRYLQAVLKTETLCSSRCSAEWLSVLLLWRSAYCSRKLRRLYKAHKLTHGRAKYTRRQLEATSIRDGGQAPVQLLAVCLKPVLAPPHLHCCRQLLIPLMSAERAWSVAMSGKAQLDKSQKHKSYKHLHQVGACKPRLQCVRFLLWTRGRQAVHRRSGVWPRLQGTLPSCHAWQSMLASHTQLWRLRRMLPTSLAFGCRRRAQTGPQHWASCSAHSVPCLCYRRRHCSGCLADSSA